MQSRIAPTEQPRDGTRIERGPVMGVGRGGAGTIRGFLRSLFAVVRRKGPTVARESDAPDATTARHQPMHHHGGGHAHGGFHHGAERLAQVLDDPEREAWQKPRDVVAAATIAEGMVVADIGAGTGYFEPHLSHAVGQSGRVIALDSTPDLVAHMQRRFKQARLGNVDVRLVPPADPGLAAGSVDRVLIVDAWHHLHNRVAYARKLRQALTTTGRIVIVDYPLDAPKGPPRNCA